MKKAVFLDRDGVVNVDISFAHKPEQITFMPGLFDFCRKATAEGYLLIIITNQSGIGRGMFSEDEFHALMRWMETRFKKENCPLAAYYYCPHHPDAGCACRKPKPGMILEAAKKYDIDLTQSMLIGDQPRDIEAGKAAGVGRLELFKGDWPF